MTGRKTNSMVASHWGPGNHLDRSVERLCPEFGLGVRLATLHDLSPIAPRKKLSRAGST